MWDGTALLMIYIHFLSAFATYSMYLVQPQGMRLAAIFEVSESIVGRL